MTTWGAELDPDRVLPEYPRPQMVRKQWQNLNGVWELQVVSDAATPLPFGKTLPERILVPFAIESALSGVTKHADHFVYRRLFTRPPELSGDGRLLLHFGAVDWRAQVYVNGRAVADHTGGYDAFTVDVTDALSAAPQQELVVDVHDPTDAYGQPRGKQTTNPSGIFYTPVSGIWQTVWLEAVPGSSIDTLRMTPDVAAGSLALKVGVRGVRKGQTVEAVALAGGKEVSRVQLAPGVEGRLPVPRARLWGPEDPFLYDLRVVLRDGGTEVDQVDSYFGMRSVALAKDPRGFTRMALNGKPWFHVGPLDQGWWPDGLYTAPTDAALRFDLETTRALGFNATRKHIKVEPQRWYYHADRLGIPVWQDMPSGGNDTPEARRHFESELRAMLEDLHNHPSIIAWVPFNEMWGQWSMEETRRIAGEVHREDPSRLVNDASGWQHAGAGDMIDVHSYPGPQALVPSRARATVVGEFGGLGLVIGGHVWSQLADDPSLMKSQEAMNERYELLMKRMWRLRDTHGMSAGMYTELTDVEGELNGVYTYDRRVLKFDAERLAAVNRGFAPMILPEFPELTTPLEVSITQGTATEVRYTVDGTEPSASSPIYRHSFTVDRDTVVRARAFAGGRPTPAPEARTAFRKVVGREPVANVRVVPGLEYAYFPDPSTVPSERQPWVVRKLLDQLEVPIGTMTMSFSPPGGGTLAVKKGTAPDLTLALRDKDEMFGFAYVGFIRVPRDGVYTFTAVADDAAVLWIGETRLLGDTQLVPVSREDAGAITLRAGLHPMRLHYFNAYGAMGLELYIAGPGLPRQRVPASMLFRADGPAP
jgi:hypothetical protein